MNRPVLLTGWLALSCLGASAFAAVRIASTTLPAGTVGTSYNASLGANGGQTPYTWSGTAPAGLTLHSGGVVDGTPNASGDFSFSATVKDSNDPAGTDTKTISITISPAPLSVTTSSLSNGTVGVSYAASLGASGGNQPYSFSATGLPAGLSVSGSQITGNPSAAGTVSVTLKVTDSTTPTAATATRTVSLTINPAPLAITTGSLPSGTMGSPYTATLAASGGTSPYTFSASGLPAGLSVSGNQITGTPNTAGNSNVTIMVSDSATPANNASKPLTLTINPAPLTVTTGSLPGGTMGSPYSATLAASGGTSPYTFSASGLPAGLSVSGNQITGTPNTAGNSNVTIMVSDSATPANNASKPLSLTINPAPLTVTTGSLASGTMGSPYSATLAASGGTSPYTFSASGLPAGLSVSGNQITGTPNTAGTSNVTIMVSDSATPANNASKPLTLTINPAPLTVTTGSLPSGTMGSPYTATLAASGGTSPYTFSASGLPAGLSVSGNQITGTPNTAGNSNVTIMVSDSATPANNASKPLSLTINPAALTITTGSLSSGTMGSPYTATLAASGGTSPYTFSASGLPAGLSVSGNQITGTPNSAGTSNVTIMVSDSATPANHASKPLTLTINPATLTVTTGSLASGTMGSPYTATLAASGGTSPYTFSASGLPAGLSVSGNQISGTPNTAGTSNVTIMVTDSATPANTASKPLSLTINPATLTVTTGSLPSGTMGSPYTATLAASGGTSPYTFSASGLPAGLSVSGNQITGTPNTAGASNVTIMVTDSATPANNASKPLTLTINPATLTVTTGSLPSGTMGSPYTATLAASGGTSPYTFSASGLPAGLSVSGNQITGTPNTAGASNVTIMVTDSATPANNASKPLTLTINPAALTITTASLPTGTMGSPYTATLAASGGTPPYTFSATGLPSGLSVSGNQISGVPTSAGTSNVTVMVSDSASPANATSKALSIVINTPPLNITTSSLASGTVGSTYTTQLGATGGTSPYTFSATGLPADLAVNGNQITGTPSSAGTFSINIRATDSATPANSVNKTLPLTIGNPPLSLTTSNLPSGTTGSPYSASLAASGGTGAYTFAATGLPAGLGISGNQITGTPSGAGTVSVTLRVSDSASPPNTANRAVPLTINNAPVTITTTGFPNGTVGVAYSQSVGAAGGTGTYTYSVSSGALPAGLTLSGNQISGTPTTAGPTSFTIQATDTANASATRALGITINPPPVSVATTTLSNGTVGVPYSAPLAANGGTGTYTFSLAAGTLPPGLALQGNLIGGTPTRAGSQNFTVRATDTANSTATQALTLTIVPAPVTFTTSSLPNGTVGTGYSQSLAAAGGTGAYTYSVTAGSLPPGLNLSGNQIAGTPASAGPANFTIKAADANNPNSFATQAFSITIFAGLTITACPAPAATVGQPYATGLSASGGVPPYVWSLGGASLPAGLSLDGPSGQISGVPTQFGSYLFNVKLADNGGSSANQNCSIAVAPALAIATAALPDGSQDAGYSQVLSASGGQPPYTWSVAAGALPPGLSLASGGQLAGTPSAAGTSAFTVRVTDKSGASATGDLSIRVASALALAGCPTATAIPNQAYSSLLTGSGGQPPYTFSITGQLPPGLALDSRSGAISGTPTRSGAMSFTVALADSASVSVAKPCSITVSQAVAITTGSLPSTTTGGSYSQQMSASGGTPPYTWSITAGVLPPGLSMSASGQISGAAGAPGTFAFSVQAAAAAGGAASASFTIQVAGSISIGTCPAPSAVAGQPYNATFSATGGQLPYAWSLVSGLLPAGVRLNSILGSISGTPVDLGNYNYTVQVQDRAGAVGSISCALTVTPALTITNASVPDATLRSPYSQPVTVTGGQPPYTWSLAAGSLPPGLTLNSSTGLIAGTPAQTGTFPFTVVVGDSGGSSVQRQYTIPVAAGLVIPACPASSGELRFAYASSITAAGGSQPYAFSISGSLPPGLSFDSVANAIVGSPTQSGPFSYTIAAVDRGGATVRRDCTFDIRDAVRIVNDSLPGGSGGTAYLATLSAAAGLPPYTWSTSAGALPPGLFLNAGTGQISGTPTIAASYRFTAQITDSIGAQTTKDFTIAITQGLVIVDCPLPAAIVGQSYSAPLVAAGGNPPFAWTLSAGALPPGLALLSDAALVSGIPNQLGPYSYVLRVDDASARSSTRACSIQVTTANLGVTNNPALPAALTGVAYTQNLGASGGRAPYTWSVVDGALPDGITLDAAGKLSGTPSTPGSYQFTVQLTDQDGTSVQQLFTLVVQAGTAPNVRITGLPDIIAPAQQPVFDLQLDSSYPLPIAGTITLTFVPDPDVQTNDPAIQFATGGRTINFSVPANSTKVTFAAPIAALQTGTVAGTIQLTVRMLANGADITPSPAPQRSMRVDRLAPKITSVTITKNTSGFSITIVGYSTTRDVTQGAFRFAAANGTTTDVTVPLADSARAWFQSSASTAFGAQFSLTLPFNFQGQAQTLTSVSVTLTNGQGVSASTIANF